jgi:hypothetical protein
LQHLVKKNNCQQKKELANLHKVTDSGNMFIALFAEIAQIPIESCHH